MKMAISILVLLLLWTDLARADAGELFREMERRLLESEHLYIRYEMEAKGVVQARFQGELELRQGNWVEMTGNGHFMTEESEIGLHSDGTHMSGGRYPVVFAEKTLPELQSAIIIGLTRMGLMHNAARLHSGGAPDHAEGGVGDWVQTHDYRSGTPVERDGVRAVPVSFDLTVNGQPAGNATLWIGEASGLPVEREQTVHFEGGDMMVVERFQITTLGAQRTCPPCRQKLDDYGFNVYVTRGAQQINVCCAGCLDKVEKNWDGYAGILTDLGEAPSPVHPDEAGIVAHNDIEAGVCPPCQGGLCQRPEHLPPER